MENLINYDLDLSPSDESDNESDNELKMDLIMMDLKINLVKDKAAF